jgi:hypothetical protein
MPLSSEPAVLADEDVLAAEVRDSSKMESLNSSASCKAYI